MAQDVSNHSAKQLVIMCFYYPECASRDVLPERLACALTEEGVEAEVRHHTLSVEEARARGVEGSPTVMIDGADILEMASDGGT